MAINFWCAECGQPLAADDIDAGREVDCIRCKAIIRVPRNPAVPAVESSSNNPLRLPPVFAPEDADPARAGLRLVMGSFWLFIVGVVGGLAVLAFEELAKTPLPAAIKTATDAFEVGTLVLGGVLRVVGYLLSRHVGRLLEVEWTLICGVIGALFATAGLATVSVIDITTDSLPGPTLEVVSYLAAAIGLIGYVVESAVLWFFRQVLAETRPPDARLVTVYLFLLVGATLAFPVVVLVFIPIIMIIVMIRTSFIPTPAWLPTEPEVIIGSTIAGFAGLVLALQIIRYYLRLLSRCRSGLAAATRTKLQTN
jgi:DNA-directed RNA polymerase subunit RPC12/RpoP